MADAVILLVLVLAALWGLNRGLVGPLVGEFAFVISLFAVYRLHADRVLWPLLPRFAASLVAVAGLTLVLGILLRPLARGPVEVSRRDVNRPTRLHWLGSGQQGDWFWDAFLVFVSRLTARRLAAGC